MPTLGTCLLILCLIPAVLSASSTTHKLNLFLGQTPQKIPDIADGSKIYLSSRDKAAYLARITLSTKGATTTLDKLLSNFDVNGFLNGWPVNSDLTIATTNSDGLTKNLTGELFVATPVMAKDPNFLVSAVRGTKMIDSRKASADTTIVFLAVYNSNTDGLPDYAGFQHIHVDSIVQPKATSLSFYSYLPDDNYADVTKLETTRRRIFSNPLNYFASGTQQSTFFSLIDPLQFSRSVWFRSVGGFELTVSENYVDTTTIQAEASTVTGISNSQLLTYNSQVNFKPMDANRMGTSGYILTTELFTNSNLTLQLNGQGALSSSFQVAGTQNVVSSNQVQPWPAVSLQIKPSGAFSGLYYAQYFNIDGGPVTTAAPATTANVPSSTGSAGSSSMPPVNPASSSSPAPTSPPTVTTQSVDTTTKHSSVTLTLVSVFATLAHYVLLNH